MSGEPKEQESRSCRDCNNADISTGNCTGCFLSSPCRILTGNSGDYDFWQPKKPEPKQEPNVEVDTRLKDGEWYLKKQEPKEQENYCNKGIKGTDNCSGESCLKCKAEQEYEEKKNEIINNLHDEVVDYANGIQFFENVLKRLEALALKQGERIGYEKGCIDQLKVDHAYYNGELIKTKHEAENNGKRIERRRIKGLIMEKMYLTHKPFDTNVVPVTDLLSEIEKEGKQ